MCRCILSRFRRICRSLLWTERGEPIYPKIPFKIPFASYLCCIRKTLPSIVAKQQQEKAKRDGASEAHPASESPLLNHGGDVSYGTNSTQPRHPTGMSETPTLVEEESIAKSVESRGGLQTILTRPILLVLSSYVFLVFIDMSNFVLVPLFYSTPLEYGGLGLDPYHIGVTLGTFGFLNSIIQANLLGQLIRKHGSRRMFQVGFSSFILSTSLFPVMKHFSQRAGGVDKIVILLIIMQLGCSTMIFMAYGMFHIYYQVRHQLRLFLMQALFKCSSCNASQKEDR